MMSARGEIVRSGYLIKSPPDAQKIAQWKKRWFVLADSRLVYPLADRYVRLEYYASEMEAKRLADPKGKCLGERYVPTSSPDPPQTLQTHNKKKLCWN